MERMKRLFTKQDKDLIFKLWKSGNGFSDIAKKFDAKPGTIFTMLRDTGGIKPADTVRSEQHLTLAEREEIRVGLSTKKSLRAIAHSLGRSPSTISREIKRNGAGDIIKQSMPIVVRCEWPKDLNLAYSI